MKSFIRIPVAVALLAILFSSCQKDFVIVDTLNPPLLANDSNYLDKIFYIDSVAGVKDTFRIVSYFYDAQKRVTRIIDSADTGPNFSLWPESSYDYYYNGTDTIPFKSLYKKYSTPTNHESQYIFYYYDALLRRVKDSTNISSISGGTVPQLTNYSYTANSITSTVEIASVIYSTNIASLDSRGNMIKSELEPDGVFTYQFDNKPSPFARLSNFRTLEIWVEDESEGYFYMIKNNNNVLKIENFMPSRFVNATWDVTGGYIYRADGYPLIIKDELSPGEFEIISLKYRSF